MSAPMAPPHATVQWQQQQEAHPVHPRHAGAGFARERDAGPQCWGGVLKGDNGSGCDATFVRGDGT